MMTNAEKKIKPQSTLTIIIMQEHFAIPFAINIFQSKQKMTNIFVIAP